jgi:hypothetical protein
MAGIAPRSSNAGGRATIPNPTPLFGVEPSTGSLADDMKVDPAPTTAPVPKKEEKGGSEEETNHVFVKTPNPDVALKIVDLGKKYGIQVSIFHSTRHDRMYLMDVVGLIAERNVNITMSTKGKEVMFGLKDIGDASPELSCICVFGFI